MWKPVKIQPRCVKAMYIMMVCMAVRKIQCGMRICTFHVSGVHFQSALHNFYCSQLQYSYHFSLSPVSSAIIVNDHLEGGRMCNSIYMNGVGQKLQVCVVRV